MRRDIYWFWLSDKTLLTILDTGQNRSGKETGFNIIAVENAFLHTLKYSAERCNQLISKAKFLSALINVSSESQTYGFANKMYGRLFMMLFVLFGD